MIEKLNEERKKLQDENVQIKEKLGDDRKKILKLEAENSKLKKDKKLAQQEQKALSELNKVSYCRGLSY